MKTTPYLLILILIIVSCSQKNPGEYIPYIGGYWEIKSAEIPEGGIREFTMNTTIDFIEVQGDSGVRKKLVPRLDGKFTAYPSVEKFRITQRNDSLLLQYKTPYDQWTEVVLNANNEILVVKNKEGRTYTYQRYTGSEKGDSQ